MFVTIGVLLLIAALSALSRVVDFDLGFSVIALVSAWGLAEFFSRRMRLALPSIVLALMFAGAAAFLGADLGSMVLGLLGALPSGEAVGGRTGFNTAPMMIFAGLGAAIAAGVHERRFHVPIDGAIAAAGILGAVCGVAARGWRLTGQANTGRRSSPSSASAFSPWPCEWMRPIPSAARAAPTSPSGCICWPRR